MATFSYETPSDHNVFNTYMSLPQSNRVQAEYIWIGALSLDGRDLRSKTKTIELANEDEEIKCSDLPIWNYDGSSTGQAPGSDSEVFLKPVAIFRDPWRRGRNVLVLCESCLPDGKLSPIPTNTRRAAAAIMESGKNAHPWFGIEQEYTLFRGDGLAPLGWPVGGFPAPQGPYYCGAGAEKAFGRRIVESHYRACLYAGVKIAGCNGEVMPGQWEYQVGPCEGIQAGDHLIVSRYILSRVCEDFGVRLSLDPKPILGDWNGAGAHTNYSTEAMRNDGGWEHVLVVVDKLRQRHLEHIGVYGVGNEKRLTGAHETAPMHAFSCGIAHRGASVRIPRDTFTGRKGYIEDRRPASNMDPYIVTAMIVKTTIIDKFEKLYPVEMKAHASFVASVGADVLAKAGVVVGGSSSVHHSKDHDEDLASPPPPGLPPTTAQVYGSSSPKPPPPLLLSASKINLNVGLALSQINQAVQSASSSASASSSSSSSPEEKPSSEPTDSRSAQKKKKPKAVAK